MLQLPRFAGWVAASAIAGWALAADGSGSSTEKARDALALLQSGAPPQEKALACKQLAIYGNAEAVPALAGLLSDPHLASWARIALEVIPGPAADDALRAATARLHGELLVGVINSIGVRGDRKAVGALAAKLNDADVEVASAAAIAIGRIGGAQAAHELLPALAHAPLPLRSPVAQGCILCAERCMAEGLAPEAVRLYDAVRHATVPKTRVLEALRGSILARKADGLPLLLQALRSEDKGVFSMALRTARELPGRAVTKALAAELARTSAERRTPLLLALADRSDSAAWPAVIGATRPGPKALRLAAIGLLAQRGDSSAAAALLDMLAESDSDLAIAARAALARLPDEVVDPLLSARLGQGTGTARRTLIELAGERQVASAVPVFIKATEDADPGIRAAAIDALSAIASRQPGVASSAPVLAPPALTRPAFLKAANDSAPAVRTAGLRALGATAGVEDLPRLIGLLVKPQSADDAGAVERALASACARIPDKEACADELLASFASSAAPCQCALLRLLGGVGTTKALEAVRSALANQDPTVHDTAVRVLAGWPDAAALPPLLELFRTATNPTHRFLALRGCVRLLELGGQSPQQTISAYRQLLAGAQNPDDRKAILSGLGNVPDPAALQLADPLRANPEVQAEAELAMINIAAGIVRSHPAEAKAVAKQLQTDAKSAAIRDRAATLLRQIDIRRNE